MSKYEAWLKVEEAGYRLFVNLDMKHYCYFFKYEIINSIELDNKKVVIELNHLQNSSSK